MDIIAFGLIALGLAVAGLFVAVVVGLRDAVGRSQERRYLARTRVVTRPTRTP